MLRHSEAFSFQVAADTQEETDRYWNAIIGHGAQERACGWCQDRWGLSWQITPPALTEAIAAGGDEAKRAFAAMMDMTKVEADAPKSGPGCLQDHLTGAHASRTRPRSQR